MQTILLSVLIVASGTGPINAVFVFFVTQNLQVPARLYDTLDTAVIGLHIKVNDNGTVVGDGSFQLTVVCACALSCIETSL